MRDEQRTYDGKQDPQKDANAYKNETIGCGVYSTADLGNYCPTRDDAQEQEKANVLRFPNYAAVESRVRVHGNKKRHWLLSARGVSLGFSWTPPGVFKTKRLALQKMKNGKWSYVEQEPHYVKVTKGFWILETQVTVEAFEAFSQATGYSGMRGANGFNSLSKEFVYGERYTYKSPGFPEFHLSSNYPATCVDWSSANAFCSWLNDEFQFWRFKSGNVNEDKKRYDWRLTFRLPTEAEWELACRAGSNYNYFFGNDYRRLADYGNYDGSADGANKKARNVDSACKQDDGYDFLAPTGIYSPNEKNLYDMHGNVWEWCADWYAPYPKSSRWGKARDPVGPATGKERVVRGGSWDTRPDLCASFTRASAPPSWRDVRVGFRVVLECGPTNCASMFRNVVVGSWQKRNERASTPPAVILEKYFEN
ncbi:MAG: formylglycine-generating enzyme family protein, partial [Thermoguttaceae bacterium]|nr:formylglycine-generating enzyme family protein [Thermoguttaceae bacterium]